MENQVKNQLKNQINAMRCVALESTGKRELVKQVENVCVIGDGLDQMQDTQGTIKFWRTIVEYLVTILTTTPILNA